MKKKPNIILVLIDDLGYGDLSCTNSDSKIRTKNIDRLGAEGMICTDAHASSAVCSPSRYALLTGRYNWRSRLKKTVLPGTSPPLIEEGRLTLPEMLKQCGYKTACVGKWHLGMDWATRPEVQPSYELFDKISDRPDLGLDYTKPIKNGPNAKGFDYFFGMTASLDQAPYVFIENDLPQSYPTRIIGSEDCDHSMPSSMFLCDKGPASEDFDVKQAVPACDEKVLELIDGFAKQDEPFFLYYPSLAVHGPLVPADEYVGKSGIGAYGDFVLQVDGFVGKLMDKLEEKELADDTIVIFTSDNGCSTIVDFAALAKFGHHPSYHFRGAKADIWEGGHRIPYIIKWPEYIKPGSICDETFCLVDMFATFAEVNSYQYPDEAAEDSISVLSLFEGKKEPIRDYLVHHALFGYFSIRHKDWKLELCAGSGSFNYPVEGKDTEDMPPMQLYNLRDDIAEKTNLCNQYPEIVEELKAVLTNYITNGRSTPGKPQKNFPCENWPGLNWL